MSNAPYRLENYRNKVPMLTFPVKIDLGAGAYPLGQGFLRMDQDACGGATDIVWDVTNGIPLPDCSVSDLYTSHFLEHLVPTDFHFVLQEIWRVCANRANLTIRVPHGDTPEGKLPCHYHLLTEDHMRGINIWFPHDTGSYIDLKEVRREGIHLIGCFVINKA